MDLISAPEVAKLFGVDVTTIRENARRGTLPFGAIRIGKLWKFSRVAVMEYLQSINK